MSQCVCARAPAMLRCASAPSPTLSPTDPGGCVCMCMLVRTLGIPSVCDTESIAFWACARAHTHTHTHTHRQSQSGASGSRGAHMTTIGGIAYLRHPVRIHYCRHHVHITSARRRGVGGSGQHKHHDLARLGHVCDQQHLEPPCRKSRWSVGPAAQGQ